MNYRILKYSAVCFLVFFIGLTLWLGRPVPVLDIPLADVEASLLAGESFGVSCEKADSMRLRRSYGLTASDYREVIYYAPAGNMDVDEFLLIHLAGEAQKEEVLDAIRKRLQDQKNSFDGYGTNQYDILQGAVILDEGAYVGLAVSPDNVRWADTVRALLTGRTAPASRAGASG